MWGCQNKFKKPKKEKKKRGFIGLGKTHSIAKSVCEQKKEKAKLLDGIAPVIKLSRNDLPKKEKKIQRKEVKPKWPKSPLWGIDQIIQL